MATSVLDPEVEATLRGARQRAADQATATVTVDGANVTFRRPFPSPADWRDRWMYLVMTDRFNDPAAPPAQPWNVTWQYRQGGTFEGVRQQLGYLQKLGVGAIWITPVLKNAAPASVVAAYAGYGTQDFLELDERFASDGTLATAERELTALVDEAHARGIHVILDIVLNHAASVFDYIRDGAVLSSFTDEGIMNGPLGDEPPIQWVNAAGGAVPQWQDTLPSPPPVGPDDAVWPKDLQRADFFRRRGAVLSAGALNSAGFIPGDFADYRQLVHEYDATAPALASTRASYGSRPVMSILIRAYQCLIARYDFDGYRIDTVAYVRPDMIELFGNAVREYAATIGKLNFFTFGEIALCASQVDSFVGRVKAGSQGFGIDAAIDYPLFSVLPEVLRGKRNVEDLRSFYQARKDAEAKMISSHGDAGRYFVSFLDNHDQSHRYLAPAWGDYPAATTTAQLALALAVLFTLQGIPCVYYGTEQGLAGTTDQLDADKPENVREALWGKPAPAFDTTHPLYASLEQIASLRAATPPLRYGRIYFREVASEDMHFGQSTGGGGLVVFSRILADQEVVVIAYTGSATFTGRVLVDYDLHQTARRYRMAYSNVTAFAAAPPITSSIAAGQIYGDDGVVVSTPIASLPVSLASSEVQIWVPV